MSFVDDYNKINAAKVPPHMSMNILNRLNATHFSPHVYWNEFWILRDYLIPLNETVSFEVNRHALVRPDSLTRSLDHSITRSLAHSLTRPPALHLLALRSLAR